MTFSPKTLRSVLLISLLSGLSESTEPESSCRWKTGNDFTNPTINGRFNNMGKVNWCQDEQDVRLRWDWGKSEIAFNRLLGATYEDIFGEGSNENIEPRVGKIGGSTSNFRASCSTRRSGAALPSVRNVSVNFHQLLTTPDDLERTLMMVFWGQFIAHDIVFAVTTPSSSCCNEDVGSRAKDCLPIEIDASDPFYKTHSVRCLLHSRSKNKFEEDESRAREQMNRVTSLIDASTVYGSGTDEELALGEVLDCSTGQLIVRRIGDKEFPPLTENSDNPRPICGDTRCTDSPGLFAMHTLFIREHNRIAKILRRKMGAIRVYRTARRLVMAQIQNIVYNEYLPTVLGKKVMREFKLELPDFFKFSRYDPCLNPSAFNAFGTAAFRFGHSMISQSFLQLDPSDRQRAGTFVRYNDVLGNFSVTEGRNGNNLDWILHGGITQPAQQTDRLFVEDVTNLLFRRKSRSFGSDLVSRNLMRGRDHGLPGYMRFRRACGLNVACQGWSDRPRNITPRKWKLLQTLYSHPNDIDLFTGGLAENPVHGGAVGATFACIIGRQFQHLKFGDRFFFSHFTPLNGFGPRQLDNLRRRTLRDILCENTDIKETRFNVFLKEDLQNPYIPCNDNFINQLDIDLHT